MKLHAALVILISARLCYCQTSMTADVSGVRPGPISISSTPDSLLVTWQDSLSQH
jgi:hypothetical protein